VIYLLDVNVLVAFGLRRHIFHQRAAGWVQALESAGIPELATCPITELGFVRVLAQSHGYGFTVADARGLLLQLKSGTIPRFSFLPDKQDISGLPNWVNAARQTTDGHLLQLANASNVVLATFDEQIPGAFLIPA
jgi:uncharacterized protein